MFVNEGFEISSLEGTALKKPTFMAIHVIAIKPLVLMIIKVVSLKTDKLMIL